MTTLTTLRRECAYALNDLEGPYTLASSTTSTMVIAALVNATTGASTSAYDDRHVFVPSTGEQVRVRPGGYAPSTGTLTHAPNSSSPGAVVVELTGLFAAKPGVAGALAAYHPLINQALGLIDIPRILAPSIVTTPDHALTTWVAWISEARIRRRPDGALDVREPSPLGASFPAVAIPARRWEYVGDEETPKLRAHAVFSAVSGSLEVHADGPAWSWTRVAGTWGEGSGLANESDEVLPETAHVVDVFLPLAYRALWNRQPGAPSDPALPRKFAGALERARGVPGYNRDAERRTMPDADALAREAA